MPQTLIEKIVQRFAVDLAQNCEVHSGDYLNIKPAYVMTHDNTGAVIPKFLNIFKGNNNSSKLKIANPRQLVFTLDHNVQDTSEKNLSKYKMIEDFAKEMNIDFYPAGRGIGHQIMCEEGYAFPGTMVVASDSHSNMYGGLGCLGTPIVRTDAASIWATGKTWWQIPPVTKVTLKGKLRPGVSGKDLIISLCGFFNNDEVLNNAIEFSGDGVPFLSIDQRLTISNMSTEWGALAGVFPIDEATINWLKDRAKTIAQRYQNSYSRKDNHNNHHPRLNYNKIHNLEKKIIKADKDAFYSKEITINLESIQPSVSGPNTVKIMKSLSEIKSSEIKIDKAYLVSCVNSRVDDLAEAAAVVRNKRVAKGVKFYIAAASKEVQEESEQRGDWQALLQAGAIPLPSGCGPCIGLGTGLLEDGEVGIAATNRNFKGRMGSPNAKAYLASPSVVAASAIAGKIDYSWEYCPKNISYELKINPKINNNTNEVEFINGFPQFIKGEIIFCHQDNLNTDGIYPGKYTYVDDLTPKQQANVVMENYDPQFIEIAKEGDLLAVGFNFGTGSSREQAATAVKYKGIKLLIAGSFNETYKRNAFNNGLLLIECPQLINDLKSRFGKENLTVRTGIIAIVNFSNSEINFDDKKYFFDSVGKAAQELIISGGLENWIMNYLKKN